MRPGLVIAALALAACSRTGLKIAPADAGPDACVARREVCNALDDDCDGVADDGLACFTLDGAPVTALDTEACGVAWYAYGEPDSQSPNPRPDIRRRDGAVVAIQHGRACGGAHLALMADFPEDGDGGELQVSWVPSPPDAAPLRFSDEEDECAFEPASGTGRCDFAWVPCCADGFLLGPITDGCVVMEAGLPMGLEGGIVFVDGALEETPLAFGTAFEICAQIRPAVP